ncbi:alkaline phosphatase D family protein [Bdellovibrio sp. HCB288]|uniref:alkaline phosphatase D family protein n=1 Tax=Bdellovibrio sp. HCB288 TaxID=3394355 RepID=UPI0039B37364
MEFLRRDFLKLGLTQAIAATVSVPALANGGHESFTSDGLPFQNVMRGTPSILQGVTDATRTQFSIQHHKGLNFNAVVRDQTGTIWQPDKIEQITQTFSNYAITKVFFSNLRLGEIFFLDLLDAKDAVIERREFKMLDLSKPTLRYAIASCMDESRHEPKIWHNMFEQNPDIIFFVGDTVYCDKGSSEFKDGDPRRLWVRHSEARRILEVYYSKRLIPILATWDDHDFSGDDANSNSAEYIQASRANFLSFFAQGEGHVEGYAQGPGVSSVLRAGQHQFILMDDRSWRMKKESPDRYAHWGREQEEWALEMISSFDGITWIMNGSQIFPQMIYKESMSKHKGQFDGFMKALRATGKKVVFASGDVHFSEVSRIESAMLGYQTYEVTSSGLHSKCFPGIDIISKHERRMMITTKQNYVLIDSTYQSEKFAANIYCCSAQSKVNFTAQITV